MKRFVVARRATDEPAPSSLWGNRRGCKRRWLSERRQQPPEQIPQQVPDRVLRRRRRRWCGDEGFRAVGQREIGKSRPPHVVQHAAEISGAVDSPAGRVGAQHTERPPLSVYQAGSRIS